MKRGTRKNLDGVLIWALGPVGGSGTRVQPRSRISKRASQKQYLSWLPDDSRSLLQYGYARLAEISDHQMVVTNPEQATVVKEQLASVEVLTEPAAKNTTAAVTLMVANLLRKMRLGELGTSEVLVTIQWVDHFVDPWNSYREAAFDCFECALNFDGLVSLVGEPPFFYGGLGHLVPGRKYIDEGLSVLEVIDFVEKPWGREDEMREKEAKWHFGHTFCRPQVWMDVLSRTAPLFAAEFQRIIEAKEEDLERITSEIYASIPSIAVDYTVMEPASKAGLVAARVWDGYWLDLGSWLAIHKLWTRLGRNDERGNVVKGSATLKGCSECLVWNDYPGPLSIEGLSDMLVVHSENKILVAPLSFQKEIGDSAKAFESCEEAILILGSRDVVVQRQDSGYYIGYCRGR